MVRNIWRKVYLNLIEREPYWIDRLPLFISYPRTGSEWLNCVMELYFDRPRLRKKRITFLPKNRNDWMWFHDHDLDLEIKHQKVLYLYRDPIDTVYSHINYSIYYMDYPIKDQSNYEELFKMPESLVRRYFDLYFRHMNKWLNKNEETYHIRYIELLNDPANKFKVVCNFFNEVYDKNRAKKIFEYVTKEKMIEANKSSGAMNNTMLGSEYAENREKFRVHFKGYSDLLIKKYSLENYF